MSKRLLAQPRVAAPALLLASLMLSTGAAGHDGSGPNLERLGKVEFKVDCKPAVHADFNRAMALYHSFAWDDAMKAFDAIVKADPACGMAHWGRAMAMLDNPFIWPTGLSPEKLKEVTGALAAARATGLKSQREKDYVDAVGAFVRDHEKVGHPARLRAFDEAMGKLAARYPADKEASILSALITSANFDPADKTYANQLKAAKILEPLFAAQPDHPGVAHYLIHSYDYPPIAKQGLEAAKRYADIAPDAPHALHMPSHIFTRVGHWKDSIKANRASAKAAGDASFDAHHAFDYLVYAHLQLGQEKAARQALKESLAMKPIEHFGAAFAYAAMPARIALERSDWKGAARLALQPGGTYPWNRYPQAEAINVFAHGVGAARSGDFAGAMKEHARLIQLRDVAKERKLAYWAEQIDIQADLVRGLAVVAEGKRAEGVEFVKAAAAREDATEKHAVTPGPLLPAREVYAELLLETRQASDALREYEAVLAKEPNRYRALVGAGKAARIAGDAKKLQAYAAQLKEQAKEADARLVLDAPEKQAGKSAAKPRRAVARPAARVGVRGAAPAARTRVAAVWRYDRTRFWEPVDRTRF
jgi:tetratricopeptide (TPR) repeat protein